MVDEEEVYLAPENFSMVEDGVYRSAFPRTKHCKFLSTIGLKSVVPLVPEDYPAAMVTFYESSGIRLLPHGLDGNKWPFKSIDIPMFVSILHLILNPGNRPLLIHCNKVSRAVIHSFYI
jgi:tyrosine-protein phosphatase SIW14